MNRRCWVRWRDSVSDNRKSKTCTEPVEAMKGIFAIAFTFAFGGAVAQASTHYTNL